jgi:hypothetical protein
MSQDLVIRKTVLHVEETRHDGGPVLDKPILKGWCAVVLRNPFAGRHEPELRWMMEAMKPIGLMVAERLVAGLGGDPDGIEAYGKGGLVGAAGELEHGATSRSTIATPPMSAAISTASPAWCRTRRGRTRSCSRWR